MLLLILLIILILAAGYGSFALSPLLWILVALLVVAAFFTYERR
jgi:hypothetical protein